MNYLNIQPGKIVKQTYTVTETRVAEAQQPVIDGNFSAPYTAKISLELGKEKINVYANNGKFSSDIVRYKNNTKAQRLLTLGKVVGKIVSGEMKAIFGNGQSPVNYEGMPAEAIDAVEKARKSYSVAYEEYMYNLSVPKSEEKLVKTDTVNITPRNAPAGFLDDLL
jgi:hypothetical protein